MLRSIRLIATVGGAAAIAALSVSSPCVAQLDQPGPKVHLMSSKPALKRATTVFIVDQVEPCVAFWVERFGFTAENQVPGPDGKLVFASVKSGDVEVMYQTKASVVAEDPRAASELDGRNAVLFITVDDIDRAEQAAKGAPVVKPRHKTFYGSTELYVRDPGGNTIGFAQFE